MPFHAPLTFAGDIALIAVCIWLGTKAGDLFERICKSREVRLRPGTIGRLAVLVNGLVALTPVVGLYAATVA